MEDRGSLTLKVLGHRMKSMIRLVLISLLIFSVLCMVPLMGSHHGVSHLHHDGLASCSTCMGPAAMTQVIFLPHFLGFVVSIIPATPPLGLLSEQFHPPRAR